MKVKSEIIKNIRSDGFLIVPNEKKQYLNYWKKIRTDIRILTFGINKEADFYATNIKTKKNGTDFYIASKFLDKPILIKTNLEGTHNIKIITLMTLQNQLIQMIFKQ